VLCIYCNHPPDFAAAQAAGRAENPWASRLPGQSIGGGTGELIALLLFLGITRNVGLHLLFESLPEPIPGGVGFDDSSRRADEEDKRVERMEDRRMPRS